MIENEYSYLNAALTHTHTHTHHSTILLPEQQQIQKKIFEKII